MLLSAHKRIIVLTGLAVALPSCGPGNLASAVAPTEPSAAAALGKGACEEVSTVAEPYVVDLRGAERAHLEALMAKDIVAVAYSCSASRS